MKISQMFPSKYLGKEDVVKPLTVRIEQVTREEISDGNNGKEEKNVVWFANDMKPMILNRGNAECLGEMFGDDSDAWIGKSVELYIDPSVMFAGKRVGGLRVRAASNRPSGASTNRPSQNGEPLWDYSDGQMVVAKVTLAEVQQFLSGVNDPAKIKVKPAGGSRDTAKTGDVWLRDNPPEAPFDDDSQIPF